jgi:hypothetical protein
LILAALSFGLTVRSRLRASRKDASSSLSGAVARAEVEN